MKDTGGTKIMEGKINKGRKKVKKKKRGQQA